MRKILFLDIDGVLNSEAWFKSWKPSTTSFALIELDPKAVARLQNVLAVTGADIVLSSTWRLVPEYITQLTDAGIPVSDSTPRLDGVAREREILSWLWAHPEVYDFAIVDDDPDAAIVPDLAKRFVQTNYRTGLQVQHCEQLIRLLGPKNA